MFVKTQQYSFLRVPRLKKLHSSIWIRLFRRMRYFIYAILSYKLDINPYDEAVEAFEMYLKKYPNSERRDDVYQYLVNVYMSTNNYKKALASLDKLPNKDVRLKTAYQLIAFNQGVEKVSKSQFSWGQLSRSDWLISIL